MWRNFQIILHQAEFSPVSVRQSVGKFTQIHSSSVDKSDTLTYLVTYVFQWTMAKHLPSVNGKMSEETILPALTPQEQTFVFQSHWDVLNTSNLYSHRCRIKIFIGSKSFGKKPLKMLTFLSPPPPLEFWPRTIVFKILVLK